MGFLFRSLVATLVVMLLKIHHRTNTASQNLVLYIEGNGLRVSF